MFQCEIAFTLLPITTTYDGDRKASVAPSHNAVPFLYKINRPFCGSHFIRTPSSETPLTNLPTEFRGTSTGPEWAHFCSSRAHVEPLLLMPMLCETLLAGGGRE